MSVLTVTKENFDQLLNQEQPILLDFWAPWCNPCRMMGPIIDQVEQSVQGKALVGKINIDEQPELASQFGVMSIPTLMVVKDHRVVHSAVGVRPKDQVLKLLEVE